MIKFIREYKVPKVGDTYQMRKWAAQQNFGEFAELYGDTVFTVKEISGGMIFLSGSCGKITTSIDEFDDYMQPAVKTTFWDGVPCRDEFCECNCKTDKKEAPVQKRKKYVWGDWTPITMHSEPLSYKTNGKRVVLRGKGVTTTASCHDEDEFDLEYGLKLAYKRRSQKYAKDAYDELEDAIDDFLKGWHF